MTKKEEVPLIEEKLNLKPVLGIILSNWYYFVFSLILSFFIAYTVNQFTQPVYEVKEKIILKDEKNSSIGTEILVENQIPTFRKTIANEIEILRSREMIHKVISELEDFKVSYHEIGRIRTSEIYKKAPFRVIIVSTDSLIYEIPFYINFITKNEFELLFQYESKSYIYKQKHKFGDNIITPYFNIYITRNDTVMSTNPGLDLEGRSYNFKLKSQLSLIKHYSSVLVITPMRETSILVVSLEESSPQKGLDFLNKLGEVYIQSGVSAKNMIAINTLDFIEGQLNEVFTSLSDAELALERYKQTKRLITLEDKSHEFIKNLSELDVEVSKIDLVLKSLAVLQNYVQQNKALSTLAPATIEASDPLLLPFILKLRDLQEKRIFMRNTYTEQSIEIKILDSQIAEAQKSLLEVIRNIIKQSTLSSNFYKDKIDRAEADLKSLPSTERELIALKRKYFLNEKIYMNLLEKKSEVEISKAATVADYKILDPAYLVGKTKPEKSKNYLIAFIFGMVIPSVLVYLKYYLDNKIRSKAQLEKFTTIPVIGVIGHNNKATPLVLKVSPKSLISESFRNLRTNLQYISSEKDKKVILVTSTISSEGKTFCSVNIASVLAFSGKKVVLVGLDLRKPKIYDEFSLTNDKGVTNYLISQAELDDIIQSTEIENLDVITAGPNPPNPSELIMKQKLTDMLEELKARYDYVILDTPPIGLVTDAFILMKHADINIYIVRENYSKQDFFTGINSLYNERKVSNLYIVLNDSQIYSGGYGYGYGYGYGGYGYGSGGGYGYYEEDRKEPGGILGFLFPRKKV